MNIISEQEEKMGKLRQLLRLSRTGWSLSIGLLLAGLLSGCGLPFINVDVNVVTTGGACPSVRGMPSTVPPGGCNATTISSNKDATGAWHTTLQRTIVANDHLQCRAGTVMCNSSNPGFKLCGGVLKQCKTLYTPVDATTGNCICDCPAQ